MEYVLATCACLALFVLLTSFKLIRVDQMFGDSAMYLQATETIASRGVAVSQVKQSIDTFLGTYVTVPGEQIAKDPNVFGRLTPASEKSLLIGHAYFILYPIALLVKVVPVNIVLMSLYVLSFAGLLLVAYVVLRKRNVSIVGTLLFCVLIVSQPAWYEGLLRGQFYPDRLFILAGFSFMILGSRSAVTNAAKVNNRVLLAIAAVVCALINERGALVAGVFLVSYMCLYWKRPGLDRSYGLALGIALICYGYFVVKVGVPANEAYHSFLPTNLSGLVYVIHLPHFGQQVALFLLVNAALLCIALFEWRAAAIALLLMVPNIFGNIGGAEKLGWSTHYPSYFFPGLVWAGLTGFAVLFQKANEKNLSREVYAITAGLILFLATLNPYSADALSMNAENAATSAFPSLWEQLDTYVIKSGARNTIASQLDALNQAVPPHAVVSSVEAGMPLLYRERTIDFFPEGIDNADYVVLGGHYVNDKIDYYGAVSYLGAAEVSKINELVLARMKSDGYDLEHPKLFAALGGLAVVRRVH